ncbi:MAG: hypothetical protein P3M72_00305 [Candidatus Hodgkinia cicadicola]|nr:MAG: hypothetical protein P3M72_00305 [Candidatus Hodgkinia cicadicola]
MLASKADIQHWHGVLNTELAGRLQTPEELDGSVSFWAEANGVLFQALDNHVEVVAIGLVNAVAFEIRCKAEDSKALVWLVLFSSSKALFVE